MVTPRIEESHTVLSRLLQQFSQTPYACSSMSLPLNSRNGNFVYRGVLVQPILAQGDASSKRVIIKHVTNSVPKIFEELLLHTLIEFPPSTPTNAVTIKTPRLYLYDRGTNTQVLEDFPNTNDFKALFYIANAPEFFSSPSTASIGYHLGFWLPSFHEWASAPEQVALRGQAWQNDHMRKTKYSLTYDSISKVLGNYPELYEGHEKTLEIFRDAMAKEFERPYIGQGDDYGILHGDFWSGNILVGSDGQRESLLGDRTIELFIIDWEFAHVGHKSTDLGQIVGDLYERKVYRNIDGAISIMEGIIDGYGAISDEMAFRTVIYVGVHLISYLNRRPQRALSSASQEMIMAGLTVGRDLIVKGWLRDLAFFRDSALASLFATR